MLQIKFIVVFYILNFDLCSSKDDCDVCPEHVLCKYPNPGPSLLCKGYDKEAKLSLSNINEIVDKVNERRNFIAMGQARNYSLPKAANMMKVIWSDHLAVMAQRWADQCSPYTSPNRKDDCRDIGNTPIGQNIASVVGFAPGINIRSFVDIWFMSSLDYNGNVTYYNRSQPESLSDLTQLIWADTLFIGCGRAKFLVSRNIPIDRLVCNFGPKGNLHGKPIYEIGDPASQCRQGFRPDIKYEGLCTRYDRKETKAKVPATSRRFQNPNLILKYLNHYTTRNYAKDNKMFEENKRNGNQKVRQVANQTSLRKDKQEKIFPVQVRNHINRENIFDGYRKALQDGPVYVPLRFNVFQPDQCTRHPNIPCAESGTNTLTTTPTEECSRKAPDIETTQHQTTESTTQETQLEGGCNCQDQVTTVAQNCPPCVCPKNCDKNDKLIVPLNNRINPWPLSFFELNKKQEVLDIDPHNQYLLHDYTFPKQLKLFKGFQANPHRNKNLWQETKNRNYPIRINRERRSPTESYKPFWDIGSYNLRTPVKGKPLRYTTIRNIQTKKETIRNTEPITLITIDSNRITSDHLPPNKEKFLSFDELMNLRKNNHPILGESDLKQSGRRAGIGRAGTTTTKATTAATTAETTPSPTLPKMTWIRKCTRKLTCTWTAVTNVNGSYIVNGNGGDGGDGGKKHFDKLVGDNTKYGFVDGCTRTSTCTRDFMERNQSPEKPGEESEYEDYCEVGPIQVNNKRESDSKDTQDKTPDPETERFSRAQTTTASNLHIKLTQKITAADEGCTCDPEEAVSRRRRNSHKLKDDDDKPRLISYEKIYNGILKKIFRLISNNSNCQCSQQ